MDVVDVVDAPVVVTETVTAVGLAPGVTEAGDTVHTEPDGAPVQASCTAFGNVPTTEETARLKVAVEPCATLCVEELDATEKSVPIPETETGIADPLTAIAPLAAPDVTAVNTTLTVHELPEASEAGQLFVSVNAPSALIALTMYGPDPVFFNVTVCAGVLLPIGSIPKLSVVSEGVSAPSVAVPLSVTIWGEPAATSVNVMLPLRAPEVVGTKATVTVQVALGAMEAGQLLVSVKSPWATMDVKLRLPLPVFVTPMVWAPLVVPTACEAKVSDDALSLTTGATPVPLRLIM
jgi:hypothetical protein